MVKVELEERVERRDYKLPACTSCWECENNRNKSFDFTTLVLHDGKLSAKCMEGHTNPVHRRCTKCSNNVPLKEDICKPCEQRIYDVIFNEKSIIEINEAILGVKRDMRKGITTKEDGQEVIAQYQAEKLVCEGILKSLNAEQKFPTREQLADILGI